MTNIFIFNNASLAAGYGIGTYVRQLSDGLSAIPDTKVSLVEMYADTREFAISDDDNGTRHYLIPPLQSNMESETYCRIIFYFLARNIDLAENDKLVFQFNYFQHYPLAVLLKAWYINCSIVLTVHYMSWCFELKGNVGKMRKIIAEGYEPLEDAERRVLFSFANEKAFLHLADAVLVLSKSTMGVLASDYKVSPAKIHLVYNGIVNDVCDRVALAGKDMRHILFVGRINDDKGLKFIIDAFAQIADKHPDTNLVIVGDGDFQPFMAQGRKILGRIAFLGKMQRDEIENVYQSAYIGIMPSFHEQCSYTVIEMMRHGIPVIGTDAIGLSEMLDATPELQVHIDGDNFNEEDFESQIASRMDLLLSDDAAYRLASDTVRKEYEERYTLDAMTLGVQDAVLSLLANPSSIVSPDYFPHIDNRMVALIDRHPDIDADFFGIAGIGIYLWWRVLQLEKDAVANAEQLAMIKEHLIYYLDWLEEVMDNEPLWDGLCLMLTNMKELGFCPVLAERILGHGKIDSNDNSFPSEQEIINNALKICTCKI